MILGSDVKFVFDLLPKLQFDMSYLIVRLTLSRHSIEDPITLIDKTFSNIKKKKFNYNLYICFDLNHWNLVIVVSETLAFLGECPPMLPPSSLKLPTDLQQHNA